MPSRLSKTRKLRGSRSHGWGQSAGHRGSGSQGGYGETGGHKHRWTYTVVHKPDYFRKHGFYHKNPKVVSMNVGELDQIANSLLINGQATKKNEGFYINLDNLNVDKLLGSGKVDKQLFIKVKSFSSLAEKKIREAKGQILNEN